MGLNGIYYIVPHNTTYIKILSTGKVAELLKIDCHPIKDIGYGIKIFFKSNVQIQSVFFDIEIFNSNGIIFEDSVYSADLGKSDCVICRNTFDFEVIDRMKYRIEQPMKDVYCQGTKKNGVPCKRYLGKVEGKAELLCPICKTLNLVEDGKAVKKKED